MSVEHATRVRQLLTAEEFALLPDASGKRLELVRGEVVEVPGSAYTHAVIVRRLFRLLDAFVVAHGLGEVFPDALSYVIARGPDTVRIPDASFITGERALNMNFRGYVPFAPDLAVEVVSPGDTATALREKVQQYLAAGVRLVWVIWPQDYTITAYALHGEIRELGPDDVLDGGDVLPGFQVRVADLFSIRTNR